MIPDALKALHCDVSEEGVDWPGSLPEIPGDPFQQARRVIHAVAEVGDVLKSVHDAGYVWVGFQPEALVWTESGLKVRGLLDGVAEFGQLPALPVEPNPAYAPPEVIEKAAGEIGRHSDVFHLGMLYYYLAARKFPVGTTRAGLGSCRYQLPRFRIYDPTFPVGFEHVWARATQPNPRRRFLTVKAFIEGLQRAFADAVQRAKGSAPLRFDVGARTIVGLVKGMNAPENEDSIYPDPDRGETSRLAETNQGILAIADGVSRCEYGSGAEASRIVVDAVRDAAAPLIGEGGTTRAWSVEEAFDVVRRAAVEATARIAEHLPKEAEPRPESLMTTTLLAAMVKSHQAIIGNTGNCRAFLITPTYMEQVNLEDDVWHARLRSGIPPEEARTKPGNRSLRRVVGACKVENGRITPDLERVRFSGYRVYLAPDDVLLLCSDGLIEPGVYLDPLQAYQMIRERASLPAQEICDALVQEADARQKPPTLGDNVSCIVVKVLAGQAGG